METWTGTSAQKKRFHMSCSLLKGQKPSNMSGLAEAIMALVLKESNSKWDGMAIYLKNFAGKFYFPRMLATPLPKDMGALFVLKGAVANQIEASLKAKKDGWQYALKHDTLISFSLAAHSLCEILKDTHGKKINAASEEEVRHICTHWYDPAKITTEQGTQIKKDVFKVLSRPADGYDTWKPFSAQEMQINYKKHVKKLKELDQTHPCSLMTVVQLARVLCTRNNLDGHALMQGRVPKRKRTQKELKKLKEEERAISDRYQKYVPKKLSRKKPKTKK
jgi:hypothetical protein